KNSVGKPTPKKKKPKQIPPPSKDLEYGELYATFE
ncbi:unnamed protein product, partial [marine sediment metagenome]